MINIYDMRSGESVRSRLFSNGLNISDSLGPRVLLSANFVDNTYASNGTNKTFAKVFTFNRAGKAWLVKDTGLVEYGIDVPRFDNGLLIEKAATNLFPSSLDASSALEFRASTLVNNNEVSFTNTGRIGLGYTAKTDNLVSKNLCFSVYTSSINIGANEYGGGASVAVYYEGQSGLGSSVVSSDLTNGRFQSTRVTAGYIYTYLYATDNAIITTAYAGSAASLKGVKFYQIETALKASSYIKTTGTPVTRPADFLQTDITGAVLTGDWDDTLAISLVEGKLTISGYGRIRSIEVTGEYVPPKLSANFVTGEYKQNGVASTFNDSIEFNRAGKAWLVKDTGLVEYAVDVPRFDNGLLIEQAATNLFTDSLLQSSNPFTSKGGQYAVSSDTVLKLGDMYTLLATTSTTYLYKPTPLENPSSYSIAYFISKDNGSQDIDISSTSDLSDGYYQGVSNGQLSVFNNQLLVLKGQASESSSKGVLRYDRQQGRSGNLRVHAMQVEIGNRLTSLIVTTAAPVTRPADFMQTKVTGTTITGDWDSTLSLSIVDGQIVQSGYGTIRTMEIN